MSSGAVLTLGSSLLGSALPAGAGIAEPLEVTIEEDITNPDDGETSLREAVAAYSSLLVDEIVFAPDVVNVQVEDGAIEIFDPMAINGPGVTVAAVVGAEGFPHRVFDIDLSENGGGLVTMGGITISGGRASAEVEQEFASGGGIRAHAVDLELDEVTVTDNAADVFGGGVYARGSESSDTELRLTNSTISGNTAPVGGGVMVKYVTDVTEVTDVTDVTDVGVAAIDATVGGLVIERSTISGNGAEILEGKYAELGGGLVAIFSDVTMENSTISGNSAASDAGGVYAHGSFVDIEHSTVSGNLVGDEAPDRTGGVLLVNSGGFLGHSIFANSADIPAQPPLDPALALTSFGGPPFDLSIDGDSGVDGQYLLIEALNDPSDSLLVTDGPPPITADPQLGPLAQSGVTASHRPSAGSPAVNAGDPALEDAPATDQPGGARVMAGRIDLGSVEALPQGPTPPPDPDADPDPCADAPEDGFVDVPASNVHEFAVDCIAHLGLTVGGPGGSPSDHYGPELPVSRGQMASYLARLITASGAVLDASPPDAFDDAPTVHDLAINQLAAAGIVQGRAPRVYDPTGSVTRAEMATFLFRTYDFIAGAPLPAGPDAFSDDDGNTHEGAINAVALAEIAVGKVDGTYGPGEDVRRDQMASFLMRLVQRLAEDDDFPVDA